MEYKTKKFYFQVAFLMRLRHYIFSHVTANNDFLNNPLGKQTSQISIKNAMECILKNVLH